MAHWHEPTDACVASVHKWALNESSGLGFRVNAANGLKWLTSRLADAVLLPCADPATRPVLVDVGAAMHSTKMWFKRMNPDDSDALYLLADFKDRGDVHAFESNAAKAQEIVDVAKEREPTAPYVRHLSVHAMGVADAERTDHVARCGWPNTWMLKHTSQGRACGRGHAVNTTSLDAFARHRAWSRIAYVKVDVEGAEVQVLRGMHQMLREGRVTLASFEYAVNWSPLFDKPRALTANETRGLGDASLAQFQRTLWHEYGYRTYLIHAVPARWVGAAPRRTRTASKNATAAPVPLVTLVPIYGKFWTPELEICANRRRFYGNWGHCWSDVLVVHHAARCVRKRLLALMHGTDAVFPGCEGAAI